MQTLLSTRRLVVGANKQWQPVLGFCLELETDNNHEHDDKLDH